jgi:hypothetical protein
MTNPNLCFDMWTIRKVANSNFGREYWHFDDLGCTIETVDEGDDEENSTDSDDKTNRRYSYYHRKCFLDDSWEQYRNYEGRISLSRPFWMHSILGNPFSKTNDEYLDNRYRRDRYDRDNEPYDHHHIGGHNFHWNKNSSHSFYDRYQEESNYCTFLNIQFSNLHYLF